MPQFIGSLRDDSNVRDLLVSVAPPATRAAAAALEDADTAMMEVDDEPAQMAYAQSLDGQAGVWDEGRVRRRF
jgi:hypothetical protein